MFGPSCSDSRTNLFIDLLQVQALQSATQVSKRTFVGSVLATEVVLLGGQELLRAMPGVAGLDHDAGLGDGRFVGPPLCLLRPVVGTTDAVVRTWKQTWRSL